MHEKTLIRLSLIFAISGISVLAYVSHQMPAKNAQDPLANPADRGASLGEDATVRFLATIKDVQSRGTVTYIDTEVTGDVRVIVFDDLDASGLADDLMRAGQEGLSVRITGQTQEARDGTIEIIADRIELT